MASRRTLPLQRTHGLGVSPAACSASHGSTTPARNSSRRSRVKCARPMPWAMARAPRHRAGRAARALGVVVGVAPQLEGDGGRVRAAAQRGDGASRRRRSWPPACARDRSRAVGALGVRHRAARGRARARRRRARPRGACRGSGRPGRRRSRAVPTRAASRTSAPRTSSTAALAAAMAAPQPDASKPASATRSPSTATPMRTRSPHAAPPAAPSWTGTRPRPTGWRRCSSKRSSGTRPV